VTTKLVQKQLFKGVREFEIVDATISFRHRTLRREKVLTVDLAMINPEPTVNGPLLEFHSRVKCDPLLSLLIDKPNSGEFNAFVDELKQRVREEYNAFAGLRAGPLPAGMAANVFDEPPEFDDPVRDRIAGTAKPVSVEGIATSIRMLQLYLDAAEIESLLRALEALQAQPENKSCLDQLVTAFDALGPRQGAVLTYAPYVGILLSYDG